MLFTHGIRRRTRYRQASCDDREFAGMVGGQPRARQGCPTPPSATAALATQSFEASPRGVAFALTSNPCVAATPPCRRAMPFHPPVRGAFLLRGSRSAEAISASYTRL